MPEAETQITDDQLIGELKASKIADRQKQDLELLVPHMSAEERRQLMELIGRSKQEAANPNLAEEYKKEIEAANQQFRHDFEAADQAATTPQLQELESEIADVKAAPKPTAQASANGKKKGGIGKYILLLLLLIAIAAGALFTLSYLS